MDKLWIENPSKSAVIGRCGGDEKTPNDHAEPTKSNAKKNYGQSTSLTIVQHWKLAIVLTHNIP